MPPPTSCRGGAVVQLLRANGVKLPATLTMTTHDDGERVQHGTLASAAPALRVCALTACLALLPPAGGAPHKKLPDR